jgi:DNA mismatch endonuclease Vsr
MTEAMAYAPVRPTFEGVTDGRRRTMRAVRSINTKPEMAIRTMLHALGYRYRLHQRTLPGKPDIVFTARREIAEVRGCFWHGHGCFPLGQIPRTRNEYWAPKIAGNQQRDLRNMDGLRSDGWDMLETFAYPEPTALTTYMRVMRLDASDAPYAQAIERRRAIGKDTPLLHNHHTKEMQAKRTHPISFLKPGQKADSLPKDIWRGARPEKWRRLHPDLPSYTILAQMHRDLSEWVHPKPER